MLRTPHRTLAKRGILVLLILIITLLACRCNTSVMSYCQGEYSPEAVGDCYYRYDNLCPEDNNVLGEYHCESLYFATEYAIEHGAPIPTIGAPNQQMNQMVAPQSVVSCDFLRLTAPLDGLPNGGTTFYWDPLPGATGYNITLFDGGTPLASYNAGAGTTNLGANVSQDAIGGSYTITIVLTATRPNGTTCTTGATVNRAAPAGGGGGGSDHHDGGNHGGGEVTDPCPPDTTDPSCIH
jgi:hypothetical protein